ncbi:peptidyl-prolyl cis-trans isomerase FKBP14-like [Acanthaster planci]|uniref:peptidylprolyl isomerase n=1 Tax=Acanthaster planci TaxID=133434 RepID=A0A8B7YAL2_ACAPL|nr:peptidyl-prolyl cis-trans isomerase FKBP14-like [Acanthaster planci]
MNLQKVAMLCIFVISFVYAEDTETKNGVKTKDAIKDADGVCVSKDECVSTKGHDDKAPGEKYAEETQEGKLDKEEAPRDKDETEVGEEKEAEGGADEKASDEDEGKGEKKKEVPRKGEEERHLVKVEVLEEGKFCDRLKATNDDSVTVHLRGFKASDNSEFITTYKEDGSEGLSIPFRMGIGDSIKGLELGIIGMCIGERRRLTVPASLVRNGREEFKGDKIPRGEDLIFEVVLLGAVPNYQKGMPNMFKRMDGNNDGVIQREELYDSFVGDGEMFPRGAPIVDELTDEKMEEVDKNKDGLIQWEEFHLPKWDEL